jgi:hypothetical protein
VGGNAQGGSVSIVNVAKKAAETVNVRFRSANRLKFTPDGKYASLNGVAIIDLKTLTMTGRIATGPGPDGLAWVTGGR